MMLNRFCGEMNAISLQLARVHLGVATYVIKWPDVSSVDLSR